MRFGRGHDVLPAVSIARKQESVAGDPVRKERPEDDWRIGGADCGGRGSGNYSRALSDWRGALCLEPPHGPSGGDHGEFLQGTGAEITWPWKRHFGTWRFVSTSCTRR